MLPIKDFYGVKCQNVFQDRRVMLDRVKFALFVRFFSMIAMRNDYEGKKSHNVEDRQFFVWISNRFTPSKRKEIAKNKKNRSPVSFQNRKKKIPIVIEAIAIAPNKSKFICPQSASQITP